MYGYEYNYKLGSQNTKIATYTSEGLLAALVGGEVEARCVHVAKEAREVGARSVQIALSGELELVELASHRDHRAPDGEQAVVLVGQVLVERALLVRPVALARLLLAARLAHLLDGALQLRVPRLQRVRRLLELVAEQRVHVSERVCPARRGTRGYNLPYPM